MNMLDVVVDSVIVPPYEVKNEDYCPHCNRGTVWVTEIVVDTWGGKRNRIVKGSKSYVEKFVEGYTWSE